jgi:hypothetical protein
LGSPPYHRREQSTVDDATAPVGPVPAPSAMEVGHAPLGRIAFVALFLLALVLLPRPISYSSLSNNVTMFKHINGFRR